MTVIAPLQRVHRGSDFRASGLHGAGNSDLIAPFLGVDHAWVSAPTLPPQPRAGYAVVSYLFLDSETGLCIRDSTGQHNLIQPGGLIWTCTGRGIIHEEVPAQTGKTVHMLQIFVNLPAERQGDAPYTEVLAAGDIPVVRRSGVKVRVPLGRLGSIHSPLQPVSDVNLLDVGLDRGAELAVPLTHGHNAFVMPIRGLITINGEPYDAALPRLPVFAPGQDEPVLRLKATAGDAKCVVFTGLPLRQPIYWLGPMAMASPQALEDIFSNYRAGKFGHLSRYTF